MTRDESPLREIAETFIRTLDDHALALLAERLRPHLGVGEPLGSNDETRLDGWLNSRDAAGYLGMTLGALHKLTAAHTIPFEQDGPGCRCWFRRSELDRWRRHHDAARDRHRGRA
jgi:hypothetical protein